MSNITKKLSAIGLSVTTAVWLSGAAMIMPAAAATVEDLQAQINTLLAQIQALQQQLAPAQGAAVSVPSITRDLTMGSKGADVKQLQQFLNARGYKLADSGLGSPGNETEYFGSLTQAALAKFQAASGITPSAGYFGPKTRAYIASLAVAPTAPAEKPTAPAEKPTAPAEKPTAPAEAPTVPTVTVATPGVEAIITAEYAPSPANNVSIKAGESNVAVIGVRVKAKQGDAIVQRVTLAASSTNMYHKVFDTLALYDGDTKLAEITNLPSAYIKNATNDYRITFSGFSALVSKDGYKDLTVKGALKSSIDSTYRTTYSVWLPSNAVRAVDGAKIDQYAGGLGNRTFVVEQSEAEQATLSLSKDASSPKVGILVSDTYGKVEKGTMLVLALSAERGRVKITDITATSAGSATFSALYLYDGSTLLASAANTTGGASTFSDLVDVYVEKDQTKLLTIKADFTSATSTLFATGTVQIDPGDITAGKADGTTLAVSGSTALSETMRVTALAPVLSLSNPATATYSRGAQETTGTLSGTFTFDLTASGGDVWVSSTGAFVFQYATSTAASSTAGLSLTYSQPTNSSVDGNYFKIAKNQTARFTVNMSVANLTSTSANWGAYNYFQLGSVGWYKNNTGTPGTAIDFLDRTVWRSNSVLVN